MATTLDEPAGTARQTLRLTDAWTPLKPHEMQSLFTWHPARFKVCPSGRRSGKTAVAKRKGVLKLVRRCAWPVRIFFAAPSFGQAKDIFWEDLKALIPEHWKAKTSETNLEIRTHWGAMVRVFGFDRPRRIEGVPWDWGCIDEMADCPPRCFHLNVRPALSTVGREGGCDLIGVPDEVGRNQAEYEELWETGLQWPAVDPDICSFWWPSSDILDPKEIAALKRAMGEMEFQQELGGKFVRSGGKAFPAFDPALHVNEEYAAYAPAVRLDWSLDFGSRVAASLICQSYRGQVWVLDEIALTDSSTDVALMAFRERCGEHGWPIDRIGLYGDAAGASRHSNIGKSDYQIIEEQASDLNIEWNQLTAAPLIKDTVNAVRGRLVTADGFVHLHIHPRCKHLIQNLKDAPWPHKLEEYHWLAALRYYCYARFGEPSGAGYDVTDLALPAMGAAKQR